MSEREYTRPKLEIIKQRDGTNRVVLGGVDVTRYLSEFNVEVEQDRIDVRTYGGYLTTSDQAISRSVPGMQRTRITLQLVDVEIAYTGETTGEIMPLSGKGGAERRLGF